MRGLKFIATLFLLLFFSIGTEAQESESFKKKLTHLGDFRFRVEHDWASRRPDGTYREDRSRLRYRFRYGVRYDYNEQISIGARLRTGNFLDQQGPHVTLGGGDREAALIRFGFETIYFKYANPWFQGWMGKASILFEKQNELFWNDNVFPEGISLRFSHAIDNIPILNKVNLSLGHFILGHNNGQFSDDAYFQLGQVSLEAFDSRLKVFPSFYYFHQINLLPDGETSPIMDYSIFHLGASALLLREPFLEVGADLYYNLEDYSTMDSLNTMAGETDGFVANIKWGKLNKAKAWSVHLYYTILERYSVVDYFAQNDWARWDYSGEGLAGSRLTNMRGMELRIGYAFSKDFNLIFRGYLVEQIAKTGTHRESGDRVRLDMNLKF